MFSKLKTLFWFLGRPILYPQIWQMIRRRLILRNDTHKMAETIDWCKENAVTELEGASRLLGKPVEELATLRALFPEEMAAAMDRAKQSAVSMGGAGALDFLYHITKSVQPKGIIETGVAYGWSSLAFLLASAESEGQLRSVDMPYPNMGNDKFVGIVVPEEMKHRWKLYRESDRTGIKKAIADLDQIDIVHYDSDKSYSGRWWSSPLLWEALRPGGLFISDDIQDNSAFKEFAEHLNMKPLVVESQGKWVGILQKPAQ